MENQTPILDQDGNPIMSAEKLKEQSEKINAISKAAMLVSSGLMLAKPGLDIFREHEIPIKAEITTLESAYNLIRSRLERLSILFDEDAITSLDIYNNKTGGIIAALTDSVPNADFFSQIDLLHGLMAGRMTAIPNEVFFEMVIKMVDSSDESIARYIRTVVPESLFGHARAELERIRGIRAEHQAKQDPNPNGIHLE